MNRQRILVSGASIAGLSTAFWFDRLGWEVTVLERAREFRDGGQKFDVRAEARDVARLMGVHDAIQEQTTTEEGTAFVDAHGRVVGRFPVGDGDGLRAQLEILRGDLARVVLDALPPQVQVRYGERISAVRDLDGGVEVDVAGAPGDSSDAGDASDAGAGAATERYDLVVIAEGVGSSTRDQVFGGAVDRRELGMNVAYGTIPRTADDDRWWRWLFVPGRRQVSLRPDNHGTTRATLSFMSSTSLAGQPREEALWRLRGVFNDAGPLAERILDGFDDSDDVYVDHLTQIRMRPGIGDGSA